MVAVGWISLGDRTGSGAGSATSPQLLELPIYKLALVSHAAELCSQASLWAYYTADCRRCESIALWLSRVSLLITLGCGGFVGHNLYCRLGSTAAGSWRAVALATVYIGTVAFMGIVDQYMVLDTVLYGHRAKRHGHGGGHGQPKAAAAPAAAN